MKPASQAVHEETHEGLLRQVADWDIPGNIFFHVFHKPPALGLHSDDAGESRERVGGAGPASPREQPAGAGVGLGDQDRSGKSSLREINDVVQEYGQVTRPSPHQHGHLTEPSTHLSKGAATGPETTVEVGQPDVRRSVRQRAQIIPYQAGHNGIEPRLDSKS